MTKFLPLPVCRARQIAGDVFAAAYETGGDFAYPDWSLGGGTFNVLAGRIAQWTGMPFTLARRGVVLAACDFNRTDSEEACLTEVYHINRILEEDESRDAAEQAEFERRASMADNFYGAA